jgi:hypothetical protein
LKLSLSPPTSAARCGAGTLLWPVFFAFFGADLFVFLATLLLFSAVIFLVAALEGDCRATFYRLGGRKTYEFNA